MAKRKTTKKKNTKRTTKQKKRIEDGTIVKTLEPLIIDPSTVSGPSETERGFIEDMYTDLNKENERRERIEKKREEVKRTKMVNINLKYDHDINANIDVHCKLEKLNNLLGTLSNSLQEIAEVDIDVEDNEKFENNEE